VYEAFEDGRMDQPRLRQVFACHWPLVSEGQDRWIGIEVSDLARPRARPSADRSAVAVPHLPECEKPMTFGWPFSTVVALPESPSSWTDALDQQRVSTQTTATQVAFAPLQPLVPLWPTNTITVLGRGDDSTGVWCQCSTLPFKGTRIRLKGDRCFSCPAPAKTGKPGAPRKDGATRQPTDGATPGAPFGHFAGQDARRTAHAGVLVEPDACQNGSLVGTDRRPGRTSSGDLPRA
jgi:hypothetical protein